MENIKIKSKLKKFNFFLHSKMGPLVYRREIASTNIQCYQAGEILLQYLRTIFNTKLLPHVHTLYIQQAPNYKTQV